MKSRICQFSIILIVSFASVLSCRNAGSWLVKVDEQMQADAIVILMGSISDRVIQAIDLYKQRMAEKVIIVEESMGPLCELEKRGAHLLSKSDQTRNAFITLGIPPDSIIVLPGNATSTQMEAIIIRKYLLNKPSIDTILLVSSSYHTRRSSMIFKTAFNKAGMPIHVISSPSVYTNFDAERWWRTKDGIHTVLLEYLKTVNFLVFEKRKLKK
jgi:uncharacterized SAM-binding protein YcdF (DUF218 family)